MYSMVDAEFWVSCLFFIVAIIVLNFWLINLFVAVITNTFSAKRSQTKRSAFGAAVYDLSRMIHLMLIIVSQSCDYARRPGWRLDGC